MSIVTVNFHGKIFDVLGVHLHAGNLRSASQEISRWVRERIKTYVCIAPVSTIVDCQKDPRYMTVVNGSGMTTPDGMPLVWLGKWGGGVEIERTYGPDLMIQLCEEGQSWGCRHYFYGGTPETNRKLEERLKARFPQVTIAGMMAPPFQPVGAKEGPGALQQINDAAPDILWVGLGSPKQDYWMHQHRPLLDVPVMIGVGAAFDFISGTKKQAPVWMRCAGLEWLFRLCLEPRRLWRRYLIGNTLFLFWLVKDFIRKVARGSA